jgi:hypothetical protein
MAAAHANRGIGFVFTQAGLIFIFIEIKFTARRLHEIWTELLFIGIIYFCIY